VANPSPSESAGRKPFFAGTLGPAALVACAGVLAYLPSLSGAFIWNDSDYVTAPALRSLGGLVRIWTEVGATQQYYPLLHSAFWAQHTLFGDHPMGYHVVTLLLHCGSAVLFALVLRRLFRPNPALPLAADRFAGAEWLAALLFALHPVHVESVAWISEQKNTLSLAFYLAAALFYLKYDEGRDTRSYTVALAFFVLSLLCKTVTSSLPAAILVVLWWRRGRLDWRRDLLPLVPWFVIGAGAGLFSSWVEKTYGGARGPEFDISFAARILVAGRAVWFYVGKFVWPSGLNFIYPRWTVDPAAWWQWMFPTCALGAAFALWGIRRKSRAPLAAYLFFVGSLFPVLGFVNLYGARYSWVWDHWQYLPDLGLVALASAGLVAGWRNAVPTMRGAGAWPAAALCLLLGALTWEHCGMFHDDRTLYRENLELNPGSWLAHNNIGVELDTQPGRTDAAISQFREALRLNPGFFEAHNNLGVELAKLPGRTYEAVDHFREAIRLKPDYAEAHYNLGNALGSLGRTTDAIEELQAALSLKPRYAEAHYSLGNALASLGRQADAVAEFEAALRSRPDYAEAHNNLGLALSKTPGRLDDAVAHYREAIRLRPDLAEAYTNLGNAYLATPGRTGDAIPQFEQALRLRPDYADAHFYLANTLVSAGRIPEALQHYEEALRIQPDLAEASNNLGMILCRMGRLQEGLERIDAAIRMKPDFAQAHFSRGAALMQAGRKDEAIAEFQKVQALRPGDASVQRIIDMIRSAP
jgi:tetratricopeptide (TPR) repeat protein